jgi:hypothetical protein
MTVSAKVICDSIALDGTRITTYELEYPRFIHSEFMTHRALSKNSASSRAIPVSKMHNHIREHPQMPEQWGRNAPGMQARENLTDKEAERAQDLWLDAMDCALQFSVALSDLGCHKQIANRVSEPYMQMKVVCTATEYNNFFWLRDHPDADPTIQELARQMLAARNSSVPQVLQPGRWHLPYVDTQRVAGRYFSGDQEVSLADALIVSASCCAQVSYRSLDQSVEKARSIYQKLVGNQPVHSSPLEHQATPIDQDTFDPLGCWEEGITHVTQDFGPWSGNFRSWIQHRQLITNHAVPG